MNRAPWVCVATLFAGLAHGQTFEVADVHLSPSSTNQFVRTPPARGGRYEIRSATMVDLIRIAHGVDGDKVVGGPNWLELDRFDVIAKAPADSTTDTHKLMLQALLEDRFKLKLHKDTKPLPTWVLTAGKKPQLKEAEGSEQTGCKPKASTGPQEGGVRLITSSPTGAQTTINLGPGMTIQYECRNMTMEAFAGGLRGMLGASLGPNQVLDQTGLKGSWNFDVKWSMQFMGPVGGASVERVSIFEAMEKQLGLKLEEKQVPTPVLVVDSVTRTPTPNPPEVAKELPTIPLPTEFEVTDVKAAGPEFRMGRFAI
ncbi:MAG: hypothetical protein JWN34_4820, partial [Bryobacterales bacterium]|nr:hypothetical protein [Bryobacterales bacterium]